MSRSAATAKSQNHRKIDRRELERSDGGVVEQVAKNVMEQDKHIRFERHKQETSEAAKSCSGVEHQKHKYSPVATA